MSTGKETTRQKMIGMMYLVLTAMLALNVSSTVIDKFVFINESLVRANQDREARNRQTLDGILRTVNETGNREADQRIGNSAKEIRTLTEEVKRRMGASKDSMATLTGGYLAGYTPEYKGDAKHLVGKTDYNSVGHYMMPTNVGGLGHGETMKRTLNGYVENIRKLLAEFGATPTDLEPFRPIAVDAADDPVYREDPNQAGKEFSELAFEESPTPACMATVSEFESRVFSYETRALDFLSRKVGAGDIRFDQIVAMVKPESKYVAAGTNYRAEMFIAASASGITPTMTMNGTTIPVEEGVGIVDFLATPGAYDKHGSVAKAFEAAITVPLPGGKDTTFVNSIEYFVVRPVIQIQSQSVNALFFNCGNKLDVTVPALGNAYNPTFSATGGYALKGSSIGQVTIVPNAAKVVLKVANAGSPVGTRSFNVIPIPAVEIKVATDRGEVNQKAGMSAKTTRIFLKAIPDEGFARFLPDDAKFRVSQAEATLVSGGLGRGTSSGGQTITLGNISGLARKGDQLVIEIKKVQRQNFRKQVEDFRRFNRFVTIGLK